MCQVAYTSIQSTYIACVYAITEDKYCLVLPIYLLKPPHWESIKNIPPPFVLRFLQKVI